ncbi:MAG: hypothetical protein ABEJ42_06670 [Halobacteriaceae archaeon]
MSDTTPGVDEPATSPKPDTHPRPGAAPDALPVPDTEVPPGEAPAARCPYCDRPFASERTCTLHVGEAHDCTDAEWAAYEAAVDAEGDDLFVYHITVVAALSLLYAVSILGYMVVLGS